MTPEQQDTPETIAYFFDRLARGAFPLDRTKPDLPPMVTDDFRGFRAQCEARWNAGRDVFGNRYVDRDNNSEAREEECDGANYAFFDILQHGGIDADPDLALALEEARYLYLAYKCNKQRAAKRRGSP